MERGCRNPTLKECENETHTPEMGTWESSETPKTFKVQSQGSKHLAYVCFLNFWKAIKCRCRNGLAWAIWTTISHIMAKTRAGNQTGSLIPDH
jgi:hypothetical protein